MTRYLTGCLAGLLLIACSATSVSLAPTQHPFAPVQRLIPTEYGLGVTVAIPAQATPANVIDQRDYLFSLSAPRQIVRICTFIGVDQGNLGEFALDLVTGAGRPYERSEHKETLSHYDAWKCKETNFIEQNFTLVTVAHATGKNGNVQFELIFETTPSGSVFPPPTPLPTPTPPPAPPPTAGIPKWTGAVFSPPLLGFAFCCDDPATPVDEGLRDGWTYATDAALTRVRQFSSVVNWTVFRTGPYRDGSAPLSELRSRVLAANVRGFGVEVDLIDDWALATGQNRDSDTCAVTHSVPQVRHLKHVRDVVSTVADLQVTFNLGNEGFRCSPVEAWDRGLLTEARAAGAKVVGSNSGLKVGADYETVHGFFTPSPGQILTESDNEPHSPGAWVARCQAIYTNAAYMVYWRGPSSDGEAAAFLTRTGECFTPPPPNPAPPLVRVDAYTQQNLGPGGVGLPTPDRLNPVGKVGGRMILDSTPKFRLADGRITACNAEHTECGCPEGDSLCREDARGHTWARIAGTCPWQLNAPPVVPNSSFGIKVGPFTAPCTATFKAAPRADFPGPMEPGAGPGRIVKVVVVQ